MLREDRTHEVTNQPPPLEDIDLLAADTALTEGLRREGGGWAEDAVRAYARVMGSAQVLAWGQRANAHPPELRTHDRFGHRIDEVEFHPAWHEILGLAVEHEVHNLPWRHERSGCRGFQAHTLQ